MARGAWGVRLDSSRLLEAADVFYEEALKAGVSFADARIQAKVYRHIVYDDDGVREASVVRVAGVGVRVVGPGVGYASTSRLDRSSIRAAIEEAVRAAARTSGGGVAGPAVKRTAKSWFVKDPLETPVEDMVELARLAWDAARVRGVVSSTSAVGVEGDMRVYASTAGGLVTVETRLVGLRVRAVAKGSTGLAVIGDAKSKVAGWEFLENNDWEGFSREVGLLAVDASNARSPKPGRYVVVLDHDLVGILLHEALGHAVEGDDVMAGNSVVAGKLGAKLAPEDVTIVDDGRHPDGYFVPYDDEGIEKRETVIVDRGILRGYLAGRIEAAELGLAPTGNGRVQDFSKPVLVRQTNFYMKPGDWGDDEIIRETRDGILATYKGGRGGQTDPGSGTFTFSLGISWRIKNGELAEPLRGLVAAGSILELLSSIDAVGRNVVVRTSVFGGCGKYGQLVRVGDGGPRVRALLSVGGEAGD